MATTSERIKQIASANSGTWRSAEEERAARARIHESQKRRYTGGIKQQTEELAAVSKEVEDEDRAAALKRKQQQESEVSGFLEAQKEAEAPKAVPGLLLGKNKQKPEPKTKGLPGFLAVKKKGGECGGVAAADAAEAQPTASGTIGLGAYGSSSSSEEEAPAV
uniref:Uncharacterized protein n=1 Tax=Pyrodinium bahamense TaxID=73915 RepID=A0A7S0FW82_9DINO